MRWHFTADLHLGHANIIRLTGRPFQTIEEHDDRLIGEWNAVVDRKDTIVVVGDFAFRKKYDDVRYNYIRHLSGNIIWIKGNHDSEWMKQSKVPFPIRHIWHKQIREGGPFLACCHYPLRSWNRSAHGSLNFHGHCHGEIEPWFNQLDVGVDNAFKLLGAYRPFELQEAIGIIQENNKRAKNHDYHLSPHLTACRCGVDSETHG